jgi:GNAT superfamily N-acetyltransferase
MEIRRMCETDIDECVSMAIESFGASAYPKKQYETMREEFLMGLEKEHWGRPNYFVCEIDGIIVGMAGYVQSWLDWDTYEFFWLSVRKGHYGKGIGKALVEYRENEVIKKAAFKDDITILFSCTNSVIDYHKRNGYKVVIEKAASKEVIMGKTFIK